MGDFVEKIPKYPQKTKAMLIEGQLTK